MPQRLPVAPWPLSKRIQRLLRWGDTDGRYRSRSEAVMALVTAMVSAGWAPDRAWHVLNDPRNAGGEALRLDRYGKPRRQPRIYFERSWERAERYVAEHPPLRDRASVLVELVNVREAANAAKWSGKAGATDLACLHALIDIAVGAGRLRIWVSVRELAVATGVSPTTASAALKRLERAGWISKVARSTAFRAAVWQIRRRTPTGHTGFGEGTDYKLEPDLFAWRVLGWSRARVYGALSSTEPVAASQLAKNLGMSSRSARRHLALLAEHDLAEGVLDGWIRGSADPAQVAQELGAAGRQEARRQQYKAETRRRQARFEHLPADPITGEVRPLTEHTGLPTGGVSSAFSSRPPSTGEEAASGS